MSEANINPAQQSNRTIKKHTNKIKDLTKQLKNSKKQTKGYKNRIKDLENENYKLKSEVEILTKNYKKEKLGEENNLELDEISILTRILQKTEAQNEYLRDEIIKVVENGSDEFKKTVHRYLDLDIIVNELRQENNIYKEKNQLYESFVNNIKDYLFSKKYKKRKYIDISTDFNDELNIDYVSKVKILSIVQENQRLREENEEVESFKINVYRQMTGNIKKIMSALEKIYNDIWTLNGKLKNNITSKNANKKKILIYRNSILDAKKQVWNLKHKNNEFRAICTEIETGQKIKSEKRAQCLENLLQRTMKFIMASSHKINALERELKECKSNSEMYNEILESLKCDFAELETENEDLKTKLEKASN